MKHSSLLQLTYIIIFFQKTIAKSLWLASWEIQEEIVVSHQIFANHCLFIMIFLLFCTRVWKFSRKFSYKCLKFSTIRSFKCDIIIYYDKFELVSWNSRPIFNDFCIIITLNVAYSMGPIYRTNNETSNWLRLSH